MQTPHVYVGPMPRVDREIATRALRAIGSAVFDAPADPDDLRPPARGEPGPVVIVSAHGMQPADYERRLFAAVPQAVVIVLDEDARSLSRDELWPRHVLRSQLSAAALASAIRTASSWDERFRT